MTSGNLLSHIVSQKVIAMEPDKVHDIMNAPAPSTTKALNRFLGQIRWHSRTLRHLADFATPLHMVVNRLPFQWSSIEQEAYQSLKLILSHAPIVQPPDWYEPFHVFVDASDIAIVTTLMQCTPPNWYRSVYYISRRVSATEKNYSTMECEALEIVYNLTKFRHYLLGHKFTFHVVVKIRHYVRIVRRNHRGSRLEGFSVHSCNTSKIYTLDI